MNYIIALEWIHLLTYKRNKIFYINRIEIRYFHQWNK